MTLARPLDPLKLATTAFIISLCLVAFPFQGMAAEKQEGNPHLQKPLARKFNQAAVLVTKFLQQVHYKKHPISKTITKEWIQTYMESLDYNHMFFLESDQRKFETLYGTAGQNLEKTGALTPSFQIFQVLNRRMMERIDWINQRLDGEFDFSTEEDYAYDRAKSKWPKNEQDADILWEKKLKYDLLQLLIASDDKKPMDLEKAKERIRNRYEQRLRMINDTDQEEIVQLFLSALTRLYDPHSTYLSPSDLEDFRISMQLSLVGIGAVLSLEDGYCTIKEIIPGGPAELDGRLQPDDRIVAVAQGADGEFVDVIHMKLRHTVRKIRGEKGTAVKLKVLSTDDQTSEIILTRNKIKLSSQQAEAMTINVPDGSNGSLNVGVIELPSFYGEVGADGKKKGKSTTEDVKILLKKLKEKKIDGLVLDLRNNGGGLLGEAVELVGLFIDKGPVVQIKNSKGQSESIDDEDSGTLYDGPLIVLTNQFSASASEIVAGALQNYGRAVVIGEKSTHGKGTVQTVQLLGRLLRTSGGQPIEAGAFKLTTAMYFLPNGDSTQHRGVVPDISLPSANSYLERGEAHHPHSLQWEKIDAAPFKVTDTKLVNQIPILKKLSEDRIAQSEHYKLIQEDIEWVQKRLANKVVSLNRETRLKEKEENQSRQDKRKEFQKTNQRKDLKVMYYTLENLAGSDVPPKDGYGGKKEKKDEEKPPVPVTVDVPLHETINVLADWILLKKGKQPNVALLLP